MRAYGAAITAAAFLVVGAAFVLYVNHSMRDQALVGAEKKAGIILNRSLAVHTFYTHEVRPSVFALLSPELEETAFDPNLMSSTHALGHINEHFQELEDEEYYYKDAAVNARRPENEADDFERRFIRDLNENPQLERRTAVRTIDGEPYFTVLLRGETLEEDCLRCHSTVEAAPRELVEEFGPERSFGREVGDTVSAVSVRIPLAQAYADANRTSLQLALALAVLLALLFAFQYRVSRKLVFDPLDRIRQKAGEIARGEARVGEQITVPSGRELADLATAFNVMSLELRSAQEDLEERVRDRTIRLSRLTRALEQLAEGVVITDRDGVVWYANPAAQRIYEEKAEDLVGEAASEILAEDEEARESVRLLFSAEDGKAFPEPAAEPAAEAAGETGSTLLYTQEGSRRLEIGYSRLEGDDAWAGGAVFVCRDVTEQHRLAERLQDAEKLESIGLLAAGIAHEFNNLLTTIIGHTELLLEAAPGEAAPAAGEQEDLEAVRDAARRAAVLTDQLLAYGQRQMLRPHPVDVAALVAGMKENLRAVLGEGIELLIDVRGEVPKVDADPARMEQVVRELVVNAREAMPAGGSVTIEVEAVRAGEQVVVRVSDTGVGMDADTASHAVDPFFSTKEGAKKVGLGLSTAQGIAHQTGGRLQIESAPGEGTTVSVYLPAAGGSSSTKR